MGDFACVYTFMYTTSMKCYICGDDYSLNNLHGGAPKKLPICSKLSCHNKYAYRTNRDRNKERAAAHYHLEKVTNYERLRNRNRRAKTKQRFGITDRNIILNKYGNRCVNCGITNKRLVIHHIDNNGRKAQSEGRIPNNKTENLVPLCYSCHTAHHRYGMTVNIPILFS